MLLTLALNRGSADVHGSVDAVVGANQGWQMLVEDPKGQIPPGAILWPKAPNDPGWDILKLFRTAAGGLHLLLIECKFSEVSSGTSSGIKALLHKLDQVHQSQIWARAGLRESDVTVLFLANRHCTAELKAAGTVVTSKFPLNVIALDEEKLATLYGPTFMRAALFHLDYHEIQGFTELRLLGRTLSRMEAGPSCCCGGVVGVRGSLQAHFHAVPGRAGPSYAEQPGSAAAAPGAQAGRPSGEAAPAKRPRRQRAS